MTVDGDDGAEGDFVAENADAAIDEDTALVDETIRLAAGTVAAVGDEFIETLGLSFQNDSSQEKSKRGSKEPEVPWQVQGGALPGPGRARRNPARPNLISGVNGAYLFIVCTAA